jgi:hypothetical protein
MKVALPPKRTIDAEVHLGTNGGDAILAHPTMAEGLNALFAAVPERRVTATAL